MSLTRSLAPALIGGLMLITITTGCSQRRPPAPQITDTWTPAANRAEAAAQRAEDAAVRAEGAAKRTEDAAARVEAMTTRTMQK